MYASCIVTVVDAFGLVNETTETDSGLRRAQSALLT
jgi:hypothetical protein